MTRTRSMTSNQKAPISPFAFFEVEFLSSDSSDSESMKKDTKKARITFLGTFTEDDSLLFLGMEYKIRFSSFSKRPIVLGRVINLEQLEASHCVWETLVLGNRIVLNDSLFKEVFGSKFSSNILFMYGNLCPDQFEVSPEEAKIFVVETGSDVSNFGPLSLGFKNCILAHVVATTLVPRKGSLSNISNRDIFVLYCLLKKIHINWALWFREYMIENVEDNNSSTSLPYGLLIFRIIIEPLVDLCKYRPTLIDATYDTRTFSSMRYVFANDKWYKKESVQSRATRISVDSVALLLKEAEHIKVRLAGLESHMQVIQDTLGRVLQLHKDSSTNVGKLRLEVGGLKKDAIRSVNTILKEDNSIKTGADYAHSKLAISVHTSYSTFSKIVERSLNTFCRNVLNTLKYFLGDR
ncbi:hypothetical protein H5410_058012 [Solanum commersonii]|uniref:Uncharacterized protein n=1 Tax=Solanum commersonii TaxID=4109 RepID=A0A9J5WSF5_SOLCO|nr:hypothetical protein H5410_058012 [Solanum commersonii]